MFDNELNDGYAVDGCKAGACYFPCFSVFVCVIPLNTDHTIRLCNYENWCLFARLTSR